MTPQIAEFSWFDELCKSRAQPLHWVWHGYLASGSVTLLTSRWKAGKTTLLSLLLARMTGGGVLAGASVTAGRAAIVSEEAPELWQRRGQKLGFGPQIGFLCRPFHGKPTPEQWQALVAHVREIHTQSPLSLVVFDPLANVLPGSDESNAGVMLTALAPLQSLTSVGDSVLLLHHPRRIQAANRLEPRGSGALPGFVDVLAELDGPHLGSKYDRRRHLRAISRFEETPAERLIELNAEGTDYDLIDDPTAEDFDTGWAVLRTVLEDVRNKLTRKEVLEAWPEDHFKPHVKTLWIWLERAVAVNMICREGAGRRNDPFCYWLPGREDQFDVNLLPPLPELPPLEQAAWGRMARAVVLGNQRWKSRRRSKKKTKRPAATKPEPQVAIEP